MPSEGFFSPCRDEKDVSTVRHVATHKQHSDCPPQAICSGEEIFTYLEVVDAKLAKVV